MPLLRVVRRNAPADPGMPLQQIAESLAKMGAGCVLCEETWKPPVAIEAAPPVRSLDALYLSLGDLVTFLVTGKWEADPDPNADEAADVAAGQYSEPGYRLFPLFCRHAIVDVLKRNGVSEPRVALQTMPEGGQRLLFSGGAAIRSQPARLIKLRRALKWCLPNFCRVAIPTDESQLYWRILPEPR